MRQRLAIIITVCIVIGLLIVLNAASYVKLEQPADSEASPDRSTFNAGPTGTKALFDFLHESGYRVDRWRESPASLINTRSAPATFVVVGRTIIPFSKTEREDLLRWVSRGGRLVLVDRNPDLGLLPSSGHWRVSSYTSTFPSVEIDPTNLEQMTAEVKSVSPSQPTLVARGVESVLPSRFAGRIETSSEVTKNKQQEAKGDAAGGAGRSDSSSNTTSDDEEEGATTNGSPAPVVNFSGPEGALLADYRYGAGRIVLLTDPFIVANNGISRADNLQLALNLITGDRGLIAFDEFHQGHGANRNALVQYFEGTPIVAIFGQCALIILTIVWSRGRRFARPLPLPQVDRRSSLEFVASMAELQQRARAHDLALENIYGRVRRVLVRYAGMNNSSPRAEIARRVAARSGLKQQQLEALMKDCEATINGAPTNAKETLRMVKRLRHIEARLGLGSRARDIKQAAERASL